METGETLSLGSSHCSACLSLSFALHLTNLYKMPSPRPLPKHEGNGKGLQLSSVVCLLHLQFNSLSFMSVMFSSLSKLVFSHFIDLSTLTVHSNDIRNIHKIRIAYNYQWYYIILTVHTCNIRHHDRLPLLWDSLRLAPFTTPQYVMITMVTESHQLSLTRLSNFKIH